MKDKTNIKGKMFNARIRADLHIAMLDAARRAGVSLSEFARAALETAVSQQK